MATTAPETEAEGGFVVTGAYLPDVHDAILAGLVANWKLTDAEAAERMQIPLPVIRRNRERLRLPENKAPQFQNRPPARPDALKIAAEILRGFDREAMTYRGKPIKLDDVMRLTNAELVKKGEPQVSYSDRWIV